MAESDVVQVEEETNQQGSWLRWAQFIYLFCTEVLWILPTVERTVSRPGCRAPASSFAKSPVAEQ